ncbi:ATP-binding protein [Streptomyces sp. BE230]|uniref:ATP-binding protein n=1 Tax=Streptomyces sp. BE230 TaxID=3002526 RepID=UPI002ED4D441|nr:ATP-binding protein [Streptomyces sp. BE230]
MKETMQLPLLCERFFRRERRSVREAREFVRDALADWGFGGVRVGDVVLCVSELCTNALVHGVPPGRGYRLMLWLRDEGQVRVEVHDSGDGEPGVREPDGESGRGLVIVDALADRWGVGERSPGKIVWCEFG